MWVWIMFSLIVCKCWRFKLSLVKESLDRFLFLVIMWKFCIFVDDFFVVSVMVFECDVWFIKKFVFWISKYFILEGYLIIFWNELSMKLGWCCDRLRVFVGSNVDVFISICYLEVCVLLINCIEWWILVMFDCVGYIKRFLEDWKIWCFINGWRVVFDRERLVFLRGVKIGFLLVLIDVVVNWRWWK